MKCPICSSELVYQGKGVYLCMRCNEVTSKEENLGNHRPTPYEKVRARVYATGNKWAIENFHATHD